MIEKLVLAWIVTVLGFGVSIYFIIRTIVFSRSLLREVPYVPVNKEVAKQALEFLGLKKGDNFIDIGSGNGFVVVDAASKLKGKGIFTGVEISWWLVLSSNLRKYFNQYRSSMNFICADMMKQNYSGFNRVFLFLTTDMLEKLTPKLEKELPSGSRVVSVLFKFPDKFSKKQNIEMKECKMWGRTWNLYLWNKS